MKRVISPFLQAKYHKDFEASGLHGVTQGMRGTYLVRPQMAPSHETVANSTHKGVHQCIMEMDRRPGVIVGKFTNVRCSHNLKKGGREQNNQYTSSKYKHYNCKQNITIEDHQGHDPGDCVLAPVLPGAYYSSGHSYMHQTSMHSLRSMQLRSQHRSMVSPHFSAILYSI